MPSSSQSSIVTKCTQVLDIIARSSGHLGFSEIFERTGYAKSSTHRILAILQGEQLVEFDKRERKYRLGPKLVGWAVQAFRGTDLQQATTNELEILSEATGNNVALAIRTDNKVLYLRTVNNYHIQYVAKVGDHAPLHCTAVGKILTAYLPEKQRKNLVSGLNFRKFTDQTITAEQAFEKELDEVKKAGFAICNGEEFVHIFGVATPIYDFQGNVAASMCIWSSDDRTNMAELVKYVPPLSDAALRISERLGFREPEMV